MDNHFPSALQFTWRPENDGQPYHVTPGDPGGGTSYGVTANTWADAQHHELVPHNVALKDAPKSDLQAIYLHNYWNLVRGDDLPYGLDLQVFDLAVMCGPGASVEVLQRALHVEPDGKIGAVTIAAAKGAEPTVINEDFMMEALVYLHSLHDFEEFGHGWMRRVDACHSEASVLALQTANPSSDAGKHRIAPMVPTPADKLPPPAPEATAEPVRVDATPAVAAPSVPLLPAPDRVPADEPINDVHMSEANA